MSDCNLLSNLEREREEGREGEGGEGEREGKRVSKVHYKQQKEKNDIPTVNNTKYIIIEVGMYAEAN